MINRLFLIFISLLPLQTSAQKPDSIISLRQALDSGMTHYGTIQNKLNIKKSRFEGIQSVRSEALPDLSVSGQQDYGTVATSFGPLYSFRGLSASSSGPIRAKQSWDAAFGALYLTNIQWDIFAFGKTRNKIKLSKELFNSSNADLNQEIFQQKIKIAGNYLNLLVAQTLLKTEKANLDRAIDLRQVVLSRARSGLNPGVDSSIANAQVSGARFLYISAEQSVLDFKNQLINSMGMRPFGFDLDTTYTQIIPNEFQDRKTIDINLHPTLLFYKSLIDVQNQNILYLQKTALPVLTIFSLFQARGSGFQNTYGDSYPNSFSSNYGVGINPTRANYLTGIGLFWNLTSQIRVHRQIIEQKFLTEALKADFNQEENSILADQDLADKRLNNALKQFKETPIQVKAARDAYNQKSVLYKNGLATLVDITQTLFELNQAESQLAISYNNVWTALLLKSAATGNFDLFLNQVPK